MNTRMHTDLDNTLLGMLTENTGTHFLDSGGASGRMWQRNAGLTLKALNASPSATLEVSYHASYGYELIPTVSLFHYLRDKLDLDGFCDSFNALPVEDWEGDTYGISKAGSVWLVENGFTLADSHNSYNWDSTLSQVIQWTDVDLDGEQYMLLQIHGGADVRGGYTDAKLFKVDDLDGFYGTACCGFSVDTIPDKCLSLSFLDEWITEEGTVAHQEDIDTFARAAFKGEEEEGYIVLEGDMFE